jgi:hypothetical protein
MDLLKILRKRWKLTASLFVLTLVATIGALMALPWSYQAQANVLLLPSNTMAKPFGGNLYLAFSYTLTQTANVVQLEVTDDKTGAALAAQGYTASYSVDQAPNATAPVLLVTVTGKNPGLVENTLTGVTKELTAELHTDQASVRPDSRITDQVIAFSQTPSRMTSKKSRPVVGVFAGGLVLVIGIPAIIDAIAVRRSTRRSRQGRDNDAARWTPETQERPLHQRPPHPSQQSFEADVSPATRTGAYRNDYRDEYRGNGRRYPEEQGSRGRENY